MGQLPASGLDVTYDADHISHHEQLHTWHNLLAGANTRIGDVITTSSDGTTGVEVAVQPHFNWASQFAFMTHDPAGGGPLTVQIFRHWTSLRINASTDITGANITDMETLGPFFAQIPCLLIADAAINADTVR